MKNPEMESFIEMWERMAWSAERGSVSVGKWMLSPLGCLYGAISSRRLKFQKPQTLPRPVISVGNLTVGGSGKTPITIQLARWLLEQGRRPAILGRGYGKTQSAAMTIVSEGEEPLVSPLEGGDEAYLAAVSAPGAIVITAPDRYKAGKTAIEQHQADVLLLDDGFQHRKLHRDLDLVLIDAGRGVGNGHCLPAGPLREPLHGLRRADFIGIHHRDGEELSSQLRKTLIHSGRKHPATASGPDHSEKGSIRMVHIESSAGHPVSAIHFGSSDHRPKFEPIPESALREGIWLLLTGIAHPIAVSRHCHRKEIQFETARFPDHFQYPPSVCKQLFERVHSERLAGILTTEKDFWKLHWQAKNLGSELSLLPRTVILPLETRLAEGTEDLLDSICRLIS